MKKETKELIDWIKKQISLAGTIVTDVSQPCWCQDRDKAIKFLDSLSGIEEKLCFGGYIQDRNGTPCCHGDKIINERIINNEKEKGVLYWCVDDRRFYCKTGGVLHSLSLTFCKQ